MMFINPDEDIAPFVYIGKSYLKIMGDYEHGQLNEAGFHINPQVKIN